jgi:hypothetical protein
LLLILFFIPSIAMADAIEYANNAYVTPTGWTQIASTPASGGLDHYAYYHWTLDDLGYTPSGANIVFHSIYNWASEINQLAVYIKDTSSSSSTGWDSHNTNSIGSGDLSARRTAEEPDAGKSTCPVPRGAGRREHPAYSTGVSKANPRLRSVGPFGASLKKRVSRQMLAWTDLRAARMPDPGRVRFP